MEKKGLAADVVAATSDWLEDNGYELVDLVLGREPRGYFVRFFIDKEPGGVTIEDCAFANQEIGRLLDEVDGLDQKYFLEVSSPGLDRPLKKLEDFERFKGKLVKLRLKEPEADGKTLRGRISEVEGENIKIKTDKTELIVTWKQIERANLEIEF